MTAPTLLLNCRIPMHHRIPQRLQWLILLAAFLPSCSAGWREQAKPAPEVVAEKQPGQMRVTRLDSTQIVLSNPAVRGDSLVGEQDGTPRAVPLSDVASVALPSSGLGGVLVIFLLLVTAGTAALVAGSVGGG